MKTTKQLRLRVDLTTWDLMPVLISYDEYSTGLASVLGMSETERKNTSGWVVKFLCFTLKYSNKLIL